MDRKHLAGPSAIAAKKKKEKEKKKGVSEFLKREARNQNQFKIKVNCCPNSTTYKRWSRFEELNSELFFS